MLQACRQAQHKTFIDEAEHQSSSPFIIKNERFMIKLKLLINQREDIYKIRMQLFFFPPFMSVSESFAESTVIFHRF